MSVNVKTIPTVLDSGKKTGVVVVTNIGANGVNAGQAIFKEIQAEQANINNIQSNNINTSTLNAEIVTGAIINGDQGNFDELNAQQANIYNEHVENSHIDSLYADYAGIKQLKVDEADIDVGRITELFSKEITTDYLTVLKSAHFFELIIDKIKAVGGSFILSPADGFELWGSQYLNSSRQPITNSSQYSNASYIRLFWVCSEDGLSGKYNMWEVGDQALCQNFNNAQVGVNHNVSSKYCWAMVTHINNREANWVVKLEEGSDVVTIVDSTYDSTHPTWRKSDFLPISGVWKNNNSDEVISGADYAALSDSDKENYTMYNTAYYAVAESDNIIYITQDQYQGVSGHPLSDGYYLRSYNKADCKKCFSINISTSNCDGGSGTPYYQENGSPKYSTFDFDMGDNFVMLGHQKQSGETTADAKKRQSAIYLSAYGSIDQDLKAPLIAQYIGISGFDLSSCKWSWFDANGAKFQGQFILQDGTEIDENVFNYFKLVPNYNIFSRNGAGDVDQQTIDVNILRNIEGVVTYNSTVPTGYTLKAKSYNSNGGVISTVTKNGGQSATNIAVPYNNASFHHMVLELSENATTPKIVDEYIINIQLVSQGSQGTVGPQGPQGPSGDDGTNVTLLVTQELCGVRIDNVSTQEEFKTMTTSLYTKLQYQLVKIEGDTATVIPFDSTGSDRTGYKITLSCSDLKTGSTPQSWYTNSHNQDGTVNTTDGWSYDSSNDTLSFTQNNILEVINPSSSYASNNYRNYQYLMIHYNDSNATYRNRTPLKFKVELKDRRWDAVESRMVYVSYEPQSLFVNNDNILYSAKISSDAGAQGAKEYAHRQDETVIQQTSEAIGLQATELNSRIDGVQSTTSQLTVGVQGIQGSVSQLTTDLNQNYYTKTEVNQTAKDISLVVLGQQGVTRDQLRRTGIIINDGSITLDAEKTTITGELNFGNQNSGMVLYDDKGTPIIRISNDKIGNFADFNDTIGYSKSINGEVNQSSWNITTSTEKIGNWGIGDNIAINHFGICEYIENNGQFIFPSSNTCDMYIDLILNGNVVETISVTGVTKNSAGYYIYNGTKTFTSLSTGGAYSLRIRTSGLGSSSGNRIIYNFIYKYDYSNNKLVRLADGGFSSNPAPNSFIWSNSEMQVMRQGNNAIRVYNANGEGDSRGLQVLASTIRGDKWYNYSNYMPTKSLQGSDFITGTAYMGEGSHEDNVKIYEVELGYGRILIPSRNALFGSDNYSGNVYIKLPPKDSICVGWHVNICTIGDIKGDKLRVVDGNNNGNAQYRIMDGNTNMNPYFKYNIQPYNPDFIYIGSYSDPDAGPHDAYQIFHWRATTDCG